MRILYITDALAVRGGIERVLHDKMNYLVEHYCCDVHVVTTDQGEHPISYSLDERIHVHDLGILFYHQYRYKGLKRLFKYLKSERLFRKRLHACLQDVKPDLIDCIRVEFVRAIVDVKGAVPLICESHSICRAPYYEIASILYRIRLHLSSFRKLNKVDIMVALTQGDANDWKKYCKKVCVIPNVVHLNDTGRYGSLESKIALFVGRFSGQKDFGTLIEIWKIVHQRYPEWELHAYGEGTLRPYFEKLVKELDINIKIYTPIHNIFEKYLEGTMLLMTSRYEPFGLVLPEAMSCGLPVIAFDCPYGPADIINDGINGFLIKGRDISVYADHVCQLIESGSLRLKLGAAAKLSVNKYVDNRIMPKWKSLFDSLV